MRFIPKTTPPWVASAPPLRPVPAPRGVIGTLVPVADAHQRDHILG